MAYQAKFEYSKRVTSGLRNKVKQDIVKAIEGDAAMKKEIARVFQMANRRIQNIEKSGAYSPAVAHLGKSDVKGYSKFNMRGFSLTGSGWNAMKREYAKAVAFLNQPTSSATGAKEFEAQVKKQLNITDDTLWAGVRNSILGNLDSVEGKIFAALPYASQMQEIYERAMQSSGTQMEDDAEAIARKLQQDIENGADEAAEKVEGVVKALDDMFEKFKMGW